MSGCLPTLCLGGRRGDIIATTTTPVTATPSPAPSFPTLPRSFGSGHFLNINTTIQQAQSATATMVLSTTADLAVKAEKPTRESIRKEWREESLGERRELGIVMGDLFGLEAEKKREIEEKEEIEKKRKRNQKKNAGRKAKKAAAAVSVEEVEIEEEAVAKEAVEEKGPWTEAEFDARMGPDSTAPEPMKKFVLLPRGKTTLTRQDLDPEFTSSPLSATPIKTARPRPSRSLYIPEEEIIHRMEFMKSDTARQIVIMREWAVLSVKVTMEKAVVLKELGIVQAGHEYTECMIKMSSKKYNPIPDFSWKKVRDHTKGTLDMERKVMIKWGYVEAAIMMLGAMDDEIADIRLLIQADKKALQDAAYADANY